MKINLLVEVVTAVREQSLEQVYNVDDFSIVIL